MSTCRKAVAGAIAAAWVYTIYAVVCRPYNTNILKKRVERQYAHLANAISTVSPDVASVQVARQIITDLRAALRRNPADVDLYMELGAYERLLGNLSAARQLYRRALDYDRRPEIYRNLADTEFALSEWNDAVRDYAPAVRFYPPAMAWVPENLRPQITEQLRQVSSQK